MNQSWEKLVVNEGVPADVALDEEPANQHGEFFEDKGDEEGVVDVVSSNVEDVHEVDEEEQEEKLMTWKQDVCEFVPRILEEYWQLAHRGSVNWTWDQLLTKRPITHIQHRRLNSLQIILETLQHGVSDFL